MKSKGILLIWINMVLVLNMNEVKSAIAGLAAFILIPDDAIYVMYAVLLANVGIFALMDRLLMAAFQRRSGPYNIGWFGLLQPIIDGIKLIKKEWIIVQQYNSIIWLSSPVFLFVFVLVVWSVIIYNYKVKLCDFIFSIVFQLVINTVDVLFLCLLGFAGNSKYSLIGCIRSAAQVLS